MDTFHERYRLALKHLEISEGARNISDTELARRVSEELGNDRTFNRSTAYRWREQSVPDLQVLGAIGRVLGVPPSWLAWGEKGGPPPDFVNQSQAADRSDEG